MNRKPYVVLFVPPHCPNNGTLVTGQILFAHCAQDAETAVLRDCPNARIVMISQTEDRNKTFDRYFSAKRRFTNQTTPEKNHV